MRARWIYHHGPGGETEADGRGLDVSGKEKRPRYKLQLKSGVICQRRCNEEKQAAQLYILRFVHKMGLT